MATRAALAAHVLRRLKGIDGLVLQRPQPAGTLCFVLRQQPAAAVVAVLSAEFGIHTQHSRGALPDRVWLQMGRYHRLADIDALADALRKIARGEFEGVYVHDAGSGDYVALGALPRSERRSGLDEVRASG